MNKKHFEAIAEIIKAEIPPYDKLFSGPQRNIAKNMADYFETQNPRFNRDKFLKVCGL